MTPDELNAALDAMQSAAGGDDGRKPGLITIPTDAWIESFYAVAVKPKTIVDGIRIRDIKVAVCASNEAKVLTRAEAGERGEPYRDLVTA